MLSPADADVVARDPALPGLALVLDAEAVSARLGRAVAPVHLRYKPGTSCTATFRDGAGFLTLRALPADRFAFETAREPHLPADPALCLRILRPADDRRLKPLRRATLAELARRPGEPVDLLRYKPERRLVGALPGAVVKVIAPAGWDAAERGSRFGAAQGGPRVLMADADRRVLVSEWIGGAEADLARPGTGLAIGRALARLHAAPPGDLRPARLRVPPALEELGRLCPALRSRAERLALRLAAVLRTDTLVPCHGDFSTDQLILRADGSVTFVDWDEARLDDPAADLASLLARLDMDGQGHRAEAVLAGYGALPATLPVRHAAALAALATEPFRMRAPDWPERCARILSRAEALLPELADPLALARQPAPVARLTGRDITGAEVLREKPGRRVLIRYGDAIGKQRVKGHDARTPELHRRLRAAGFAEGEVAVPDVLAEIPALHMWMQERIDAPRLTDLLPCAAALHATGRALARLHLAPVAPGRAWTMEQEIAVLDRALDAAAESRPSDAARIAALGDALRRAMLVLPPAPPVLLHRDFYPDQVLVGDGRVSLLDLDLAAAGPAAIDLGNFLAHLDEWSLRTNRPVDPAPFLEGYATLAPVPDGVALLRAVSLARHIHIASRFPERRHEPGMILGQLLAGHVGASA